MRERERESRIFAWLGAFSGRIRRTGVREIRCVSN
jgi:hypothetical protein